VHTATVTVGEAGFYSDVVIVELWNKPTASTSTKDPLQSETYICCRGKILATFI
jgi:hypothetical protein